MTKIINASRCPDWELMHRKNKHENTQIKYGHTGFGDSYIDFNGGFV